MLESDDSIIDEQKLLESDNVLTYERYYGSVESSNAAIEQPKQQHEVGSHEGSSDKA